MVFPATVLLTLLANVAAQNSNQEYFENRVVDGEETSNNEYPMIAAIVDVGTKSISCGGVIIDKRYVLTAAHCLYTADVTDFVVVVGEHDTSVIHDSADTKGLKIIKKIIHPQYDPKNNYDYDIGLVQVSPDILFSAQVCPVCLPFQYANTNFEGKKVTLLGWGSIFSGGPRPKTLLKVDVDVIDQNTCKKTQPSVSPRQICTHTLRKDACQGDSGGPVLYKDEKNGRLYSLGVISNARFCAGKSDPAVQTRVTAFLDWITQNAVGANICRN